MTRFSKVQPQTSTARFRSQPSWEELVCEGAAERVVRGTELLSQGFAAKSVLLVHSGLIKLLHAYADGRTAIVGLRVGPSLLGSWPVVLRTVQPLTAVAISACDISRISAQRFTSLLKEGGQVSWRVHLEHAHELLRESIQTAELACLSARERLESFLILLRTEYVRGGDVPLELPMRDWEIAQLLAITPQYMSRLMSELEGQGRLQRRGHRWILTEAAHVS
jgi:CRP/FNR family cyclic AMP-dependent transcriptional regulator